MSQRVLGRPPSRSSLALSQATADAKSPTADGEPTVFISYSRKDLAFVDRLDADLRARGVKTLVDRAAIEAGERWLARLQDLIARAETVVFVLSPDSIQSKVCGDEVAFGKRLGKRFIPVVARRVDSPGVPEALSELNYVFLDEEEGYEAGLDRLVTAVRTDLAWMRNHADLGRVAEEWGKAGRPRGLLLGATRLQAAEHWIAHRPANAPLPTEDTRALVAASRRAARQWRNGLVGALAFGLVLSLGLAGLAYFQRQEAVAQRAVAETQTVLADERAREAGREKTEADRQRRAAEAAAELAGSRLEAAKRTVTALVVDLAAGLSGRGLPVALVRTVLGRAETLVDALAQSASGDRGLLAIQYQMHSVFVSAYHSAGDFDRSAASREKSHALAQQILSLARERYEADPSDRLAALDLAQAAESISLSQEARPDNAAALRSLDEALIIRRRLVQADESDLEVRLAVLRTLWRIGLIKYRQKDADTIGILQEAVTVARWLVTLAPDDASKTAALADMLERVSAFHVHIVLDLDAAVVAQIEIVDIYRTLVSREGQNKRWQFDLATNLDHAARLKARIGDPAGSLSLLEEAATYLRAVYESNVLDMTYTGNLQEILLRLGIERRSAGDKAGGRAAHLEAVNVARAFARADDANFNAVLSLHYTLAAVGEHEEGQGELADACRLLAESYGVLAPFEARSGTAQVYLDRLSSQKERLKTCPAPP